MIVNKVLNNNVISSLDESGREILLVGRGIGWGAKAGEETDRSKIEKIFRMDTPASTDRLKQLFLEVDVEAIRASTQIIDYAREILKKRLNKNVYITLTDHIGFAAKRLQDGIAFHNMLYWETKKLYPQEFAIGVHALDIIHKTMGVEFPEDEAGSIAIHIVNAEYDCSMEKTVEMTKIIQQSLNVVRYTFHINFDEESLDYQRFVTHMLFFAQRVVENKMNRDGRDFLYDAMKKQHPKEFDCACRIRDLVQKEYDVKLPEDEIAFLCVHIARVTATKEQLKQLEEEST
ncbi:MAG: PRD domain-containing protein [Eubacteriales bacterium]|nr:PRD domain-containing protein [Eubacteriales bacterium]